MTNLDQLKQYFSESNNIVFFGGAGVSTESGIPDFRSQDGLFNMEYKYPPETILSRSFFRANPSGFFRFYRNKMVFTGAQPNAAHKALAEIERMGKLRAVITQNIDGLHQAAGSKTVIELHGGIQRNFCMKCKKPHPLEYVLQAEDVPKCQCGGTVKPDVVLYEEQLDENNLVQAVEHISRADMIIIGGTSMRVYPAAGLIDYYDGDRLVVINKGETHMDDDALVLRESIGEVLAAVVSI